MLKGTLGWTSGFAALGVLTSPLVLAQVAVQDDFESGSFASGWDRIDGGVSVLTGTGAAATTNFATLDTAENLGARFDDVATNGAREFHVDCYIRVQDTVQRRFNIHLSTSNGGVGSGAPAVNLKYDTTDGWAAYTTSWQSIAGLNALDPGEWYHLRLSAQDWGEPGARYAVELSDAGGSAFTSLATNLAWYHQSDPAGAAGTYFNFTSDYGSNPGFDVDEVVAEVTVAAPPPPPPPPPPTNAILNISGTYPHLAVFSGGGECSVAAVMPWADRLWFITYPPHAPNGSSDKLWMVDSNLTLTAHPSSVGGTDANRLVHRESQKLNLGHYLIDTNGNVQVLPHASMPGRATGTARHLFDPTNKIYIATMEEGLYEVDVHTLAITQLYEDLNSGGPTGAKSDLPGNHGKGLYSAQGRVVYSNNGSGGSLSSWDGTNWTIIETEKFTEVTGPGGIYGNGSADRLWAVGWDTRSVILRLLQDGVWHRYRLPKASYSHDANHGWFTEWPRIREVLPDTMLMHMHGMFFRFPKTFSTTNTAGIDPICTYLRMPVDYCWWEGQLVMGRNDASTTGGNVWAGQSHSAPWFGQLEDLEGWGTPAGFGGVWDHDAVSASQPSDPFLVTGFTRRLLHLKQGGGAPMTVALQYDNTGTGSWQTHTNLALDAAGYAWIALPEALDAIWIRLVPDTAATDLTAYLHLDNPPQATVPSLFEGIADAGSTNGYSDGIIRPQSGDARTLQFAVNRYNPGGGLIEEAYYEIDGAFDLTRRTNVTAESNLRSNFGLESPDFTVDAASVLVVDGADRFRLPKNHASYDTNAPSGWPRGIREVVTERDMFQAHGTFYELPKNNSGGLRRIRPVATHNKQISDYASWRGLFVMAGTAADATNDGHCFISEDGLTGLWYGNVEDLWRMGAPKGVGGPWNSSAVTSGVPSDPYLMFGYEHKVLELSHGDAGPVTFTVQVDFMADNTWSDYAQIVVPPAQTVEHVFPDAYSAHWVRLVPDQTTTATATFKYGPAIVTPVITGISVTNGTVRIRFDGGPADLNADFSLLRSDAVFGPFGEGAAAISGEAGSFQASASMEGDTVFYRIRRN